jgi:hypothetical protein
VETTFNRRCSRGPGRSGRESEQARPAAKGEAGKPVRATHGVVCIFGTEIRSSYFPLSERLFFKLSYAPAMPRNVVLFLIIFNQHLMRFSRQALFFIKRPTAMLSAQNAFSARFSGFILIEKYR